MDRGGNRGLTAETFVLEMEAKGHKPETWQVVQLNSQSNTMLFKLQCPASNSQRKWICVVAACDHCCDKWKPADAPSEKTSCCQCQQSNNVK